LSYSYDIVTLQKLIMYKSNSELFKDHLIKMVQKNLQVLSILLIQNLIVNHHGASDRKDPWFSDLCD